jgi:histidyl-tRNA synthetase
MAGIAAPRGTQDILLDRSARWEWLLRTHAELASAYGYVLVETPIFEANDLFERGTGAGTDVVEKEMFRFSDKSDRQMALRPEGTPGVLRAVLDAHLTQELTPVRVRYSGPMFRYDRPAKGRYRQFWQVGVEAIGELSPALDAEIIELGWRFYERLGLQGVSLQLNTLGSREDRERYRAALIAYYEPHRERLCEDCKRRLGINPLRLLDCKRDSDLVAGAPRIDDSLSEESRGFFDSVCTILDGRIPYTRNERLVRGLDYYAHTTFEFWHESLQGAQNALGGGGRYDGLAEVLGFPATPAIGYALGVDRTMLVCEESGLEPPAAPATVALLALEESVVATVMTHARSLRDAGIRCTVDGTPRRLDRKLRNAERGGAVVAVIVGGDEMRDGTATVRDLRDRSQSTVPAAGLRAAVESTLRQPADAV